MLAHSSKEAQGVIGRVESGHHPSSQESAPGQLSSGCKRIFQSSSLPRIGPQEVLISQPTRLSALVRTGEDGMPQSTP
ncbi:unnamed protein product [Nezara viridula]|uniref:Uncharacterized protein n=1 Tax=Nezara viridula TaxID=85310 RepID=A0A9P0H8W9_NEZVI|nr:unnamed protein product [Nezara viridula]